VEVVLGLIPKGDNNAEFYWIGKDATHVNHLRGYDSSGNAGSGSMYDLGQGYAMATFGRGGALSEGANEGVYFAVSEDRDGEIIGYHASGGSFLRKEAIYTPSGTSAVLGYSYPVVFPDDSFSVFCQQPFPTAIRASAADLRDDPLIDTCGDDCYVIPAAACATGDGGEFLIASPSAWGDIVVTRFDAGEVTGDDSLIVVEAQQPVLCRSPYSGKVMLAYLRDGSEDIWIREWDGSTWSAESLVYDGAVIVMQMTLRARADGGWGLGFGLDNDECWLVESVGAGWGIPTLLSSQLLNDYSGVALDYNPDGDCAVALERGVPQCLWLGKRGAGETEFTWELLNDATNGYVRETALFYEGGVEPVVFYYLHKQFSEETGVYVYENIDGQWSLAQFDFVYFETPLGTAVDSAGNIVVSGIRGVPATAVYTVIWR
jgi:hypothetical protein